MNKQENHKEDRLRQYMTPGNIEKAPDGFTSRVMTHVRLEAKTVPISERSEKRNLVPAISATITVLFIATAFLIPHSQHDSLISPVLSFIKSIKSSMPELKSASILRLTLPSVTIYVFIGILMLTLFDRAIYGIFRRER
jgi:hypothetical protein